jgi:hypothetical protein
VTGRAPAVAGVVLAVLAAALGIAALQAWSLQGRTERQDALLRRTPPPAGAWADGGGVAAALTGSLDDASFRRAIALFRRGRPDDPAAERTTDQIVSSIEAGIELAAIGRGSGPASRRSHALNLQAILVGELAIFEPDGAPRIALAAELLRRAIRLDPSNAAAKANLELLLGLTGVGGADVVETGGVGGFGEESGAGEGGSGY